MAHYLKHGCGCSLTPLIDAVHSVNNSSLNRPEDGFKHMDDRTLVALQYELYHGSDRAHMRAEEQLVNYLLKWLESHGSDVTRFAARNETMRTQHREIESLLANGRAVAPAGAKWHAEHESVLFSQLRDEVYSLNQYP